ncbi:hypothetical protein COOONC_12327 [Cooperia oncophora]
METETEDPMKQIIEQSDKEMSVKEALAKGFRNYKVRLPKKRIPFELDPAIDTSVLYSLFANDVVDENHKDSNPAFINPQFTVRDALSVLSASTDGNGTLPALPNSVDRTITPQTVEGNKPDFDVNSSVKSEPNDSPPLGEVDGLQKRLTGMDVKAMEHRSVYTVATVFGVLATRVFPKDIVELLDTME